MAGTQFAHGASTSGAEAYAYLRHNDPREESRAHIMEAKKKTGQYCNIDPEKSKYNYSLIDGDNGDHRTAMQRYHDALDRARAHDTPCVWRKDVRNKAGEIIHHKGDVKTYAATRYEVIRDKDGEAVTDPVTGKPKKKILYQKGDIIMKSQANGKKKRTLMQSLVVYAPEELNYKQRQIWFGKAYKILCSRYGEDNVAQAAVHEDEIHDYFDVTKQEWTTSRAHMHFSFVPVDQKTGELSANACTSRGDIMEINNKLEQMTVLSYGVHYMTGAKQKNRYDMEELKAESARAGEEARAAEAKARRDKTVEELARKIEEKDRELKEKDKALADMEVNLKRASKQKDEEEKKKKEAEDRRKEEEGKWDTAVYEKAKTEAKTQKAVEELEEVRQEFNVRDPAEIFFTSLDAIADREEKKAGAKARAYWKKVSSYLRNTYGEALTGMYSDELKKQNREAEKRISGKGKRKSENQKDFQKE